MEGSNDSVRVQTARTALASYSALEAEALLRPLDDTVTHKVLPSSLEMPLRNKEAFTAHAARVTSIFQDFSIVPQYIYEDSVKNTVNFHAKMIGTLIELGPWENGRADGKRVVALIE